MTNLEIAFKEVRKLQSRAKKIHKYYEKCWEKYRELREITPEDEQKDLMDKVFSNKDKDNEWNEVKQLIIDKYFELKNNGYLGYLMTNRTKTIYWFVNEANDIISRVKTGQNKTTIIPQ